MDLDIAYFTEIYVSLYIVNIYYFIADIILYNASILCYQFAFVIKFLQLSRT